MPFRLFSAVVLGLLVTSAGAAQTVRFDTNVGSFDLVLNPTGNVNLRAHVDNILNYVSNGLYDSTVINRAAEDFVLQMGGFQAPSLTLPPNFSDFPPVNAFDPVIVDTTGDGAVDFDVTGLNNVRGTVSLALSTDVNTGTSSFFVNLASNDFLDSPSMRFIPFAVVPDMATIDLIMGLNQIDYPDGSLAGDDVPVLSNNRAVIVERAFVVDTAPVVSAALSAAASSPAVLAGGEGEPPLPAFASLSAAGVPEPSSMLLAALATIGFSMVSRWRL